MAFHQQILSQIKNLIRHIILRNPIRTTNIRTIQKIYLDSQPCESYASIIVFFVPGFDVVSGGAMSIIAIAKETKKIFSESTTGVFVCTIPYHPPLSKFTKFENDQIFVNYKDLLSRCKNVNKMLIHIPEIYTHYVVRKSQVLFGKFHGQISFNILLQNIDVAPSPDLVDRLKLHGSVTITTAHKAYSGKDTKQRYGCPVQHLSVWVSAGEYIYKTPDEKKQLIIISPDKDKSREMVLNKIQKQLPEFEFLVIENMTYNVYLKTISEAKFSLTFGEGLDGYFTEPVLSGGIGSAVYNERFFDDAYKNLPFIYASWNELIKNFATDVLHVNQDPDKYKKIHQSQLEIISNNYGYEIFKKNIISYYEDYHAAY